MSNHFDNEELEEGFQQVMALLQMYFVNAEPQQGFHDPRVGFIVRDIHSTLELTPPCASEKALYAMQIPDRALDYSIDVLTTERSSGSNLTVYSADAALMVVKILRDKKPGVFEDFLRQCSKL